uniref:Uncharacterized protein n=1 Tax=Megaselia scalaris TaxID=36166 RepID=T1GJA1_MEGSC
MKRAEKRILLSAFRNGLISRSNWVGNYELLILENVTIVHYPERTLLTIVNKKQGVSHMFLSHIKCTIPMNQRL